MYQASDLRKGLKIQIDGNPYQVTEFNFVKPGKGQAMYVCKLKNLLNGSTLTKTYRANEKFDEAVMEYKKVSFSYTDGKNYVFLDENFEQVSIDQELLGIQRFFVSENIEVELVYYKGIPVEVVLPNFVDKKVVSTEPGVRGDTATNVLKPAVLEGGYEISVPLFINQDDVLRIDTRTGEYVDRVRKK